VFSNYEVENFIWAKDFKFREKKDAFDEQDEF